MAGAYCIPMLLTNLICLSSSLSDKRNNTVKSSALFTSKKYSFPRLIKWLDLPSWLARFASSQRSAISGTFKNLSVWLSPMPNCWSLIKANSVSVWFSQPPSANSGDSSK